MWLKSIRGWAEAVVVACALIGAGVLVWHWLQVPWAKWYLVPAMRGAQHMGEDGHLDGRTRTRIIRAVNVLATHPSRQHDAILAGALGCCRFHSKRDHGDIATEMSIVRYLCVRTEEGSKVAESACVAYLDASSSFVVSSARNKRNLCATMVDQQQMILASVCRAGSAAGLPGARRLATNSVPLVIVEGCHYIGRFGDASDEAILVRARKRIERRAPPEIRPTAFACIRRARREISDR